MSQYGTYGKHEKEKLHAREAPDVDAIALAKSLGYFIQKTQMGERRSYALMKDGMVVLRDCRMWEAREYLEKLGRQK